MQVAILHWYDANRITKFKVRVNPAGMAFDGSDIWVGNEGEDTVSKVRASDGTMLGTYTVGNGPFALVFDGANIWTENFVDNTVTKLRASDGKRAQRRLQWATVRRASLLTELTFGFQTVVTIPLLSYVQATGRFMAHIRRV